MVKYMKTENKARENILEWAYRCVVRATTLRNMFIACFCTQSLEIIYLNELNQIARRESSWLAADVDGFSIWETPCIGEWDGFSVAITHTVTLLVIA